MDAGIAMRDMICACTAGFVADDLMIDLTRAEKGANGAFLPVVIKARTEEIVFMQLDSRLSLDRVDDAMKMAIEGCRKAKLYLQRAIREEMGVLNARFNS